MEDLIARQPYSSVKMHLLYKTTGNTIITIINPLLFVVSHQTLNCCRVEQGVYGLLRTRDMAIARYREFSIPTQWALDSGVVGKVF